MLNSTGLNFAKPLTPEQIESHKILVFQSLSKPAKYKPEDMVIQPEDNENWITPEYNHGHDTHK